MLEEPLRYLNTCSECCSSLGAPIVSKVVRQCEIELDAETSLFIRSPSYSARLRSIRIGMLYGVFSRIRNT